MILPLITTVVTMIILGGILTICNFIKNQITVNFYKIECYIKKDLQNYMSNDFLKKTILNNIYTKIRIENDHLKKIDNRSYYKNQLNNFIIDVIHNTSVRSNDKLSSIKSYKSEILNKFKFNSERIEYITSQLYEHQDMPQLEQCGYSNHNSTWLMTNMSDFYDKNKILSEVFIELNKYEDSIRNNRAVSKCNQLIIAN